MTLFSGKHIFSYLKKLFRRDKNTGDYVRRRRWTVSIVNENSMISVAEITARKWELITAVIVVFMLFGAFWLALFSFTPLQNLLPARLGPDLRDKYIAMSVHLDSLERAVQTFDGYTQNITSLFDDTARIATVSMPAGAALAEVSVDSLLVSSDAEKQFVRRFEDAERFNLSVLSPIAAEGMMFAPPFTGVTFTERDNGIPQIVTSAATAVSAVYRGTVVNVYYTTGLGITVAIQHPNDFITIYSGLDDVFVKRGEKVKQVCASVYLLPTNIHLPSNFGTTAPHCPRRPTSHSIESHIIRLRLQSNLRGAHINTGFGPRLPYSTAMRSACFNQ